MRSVIYFIVLLLLLGGFIASSYAAYTGVGLVTSGNPNSRGVVFIFPGGGPGSGK